VVRSTSGSWAVAESPLGGARFEVTWRQATRSPSAPPVPA